MSFSLFGLLVLDVAVIWWLCALEEPPVTAYREIACLAVGLYGVAGC